MGILSIILVSSKILPLFDKGMFKSNLSKHFLPKKLLFNILLIFTIITTYKRLIFSKISILLDLEKPR